MDSNTCKLICGIAARPIIYDKSRFKSKYGRLNAWSEVSKEVDAPVTHCKAKWRWLKETFVKHHRILANKDTYDPSTVDWPYFEKMLFYLSQVDQESNDEDSSSEMNISVKKQDASMNTVPTSTVIQESLMEIAMAQEDPDHRFLMSLLPLMKKMSAQKNAEARMQLQKILYDLEFNNSENLDNSDQALPMYLSLHQNSAKTPTTE